MITPDANGNLSKKKLKHNRAYVLDCVNEIFVWYGRNVASKTKKGAYSYAKELVKNKNGRNGRPLLK
eukprot:TRINITY_DN12472_c0_g1_i1.p2 TRINITY_DN12472_c0_g1~~TRINITY_DN12472_c0_g1_i1.p2  ORF type:complete len:67 (-),score=8.18 TRINITY_DN12472_c0_g1_i1:73-273(-)